MKMVPDIKELSYTERLMKLNLETLEYRRRRADLLEIFRLQNNIHVLNQYCHCTLCPDKIMFTSSISTKTRGHSKKFQVLTASGPRKNFFSTRTIKLWNALSEQTVSSTSVNAFKHNLSNDIGHSKFIYTYFNH